MVTRIVVVLVLLLAAGWGNSANAADPVRIGFSIGKTGILAGACPVQSEAYELWKDQVNARGGLNIGGKEKRMIEFVEYDDQSDASKAVQIYDKLITDDNVDLLLAPCATYIHVAIVPVLERNGFPVVGNTSISAMVRDLNAKNMFFVYPLPDQMSASLAELLQSQNVKTVAITALQLTFSLEAKKFLLPELKKRGIKVVFDQEYPPDLKDMTTIIAGMKRANPDAVLALTYPADSILYMTSAREQSLNPKFQLVILGPSHPFFLNKFGKNAEGIVSLGMYSKNNTAWPRAKPFYDAHVKKYNKPPDVVDTVVAYASVEVLEQAVAKAGIDRDKLRSALQTMRFETILGPAKFDKTNNNVLLPAGWVQVQKGVNEVIWPPSIATSKFEAKPNWQMN
ncbi:MAG: amino acid ABC transporter substrate-binding protein [Proteobacteria bacterium]|nr:amino acid ABC transporter substrate-binding protein [Pseudomonadota bacterium]